MGVLDVGYDADVPGVRAWDCFEDWRHRDVVENAESEIARHLQTTRKSEQSIVLNPRSSSRCVIMDLTA